MKSIILCIVIFSIGAFAQSSKPCKITYDCRNETVKSCIAMECVNGFCMKAVICNGIYDCQICKTLVKEITFIKQLTNNNKLMKTMLKYTCNNMDIHKTYCLKFVEWYGDKLIKNGINCKEIIGCE